MKVSIVIPVYNVEKYLEECLDSAVNQTLKDIEIICVNDGSTDSSLDILNNYKSKYENIKVINQDNKGLSGARNVGIRESKGKYIYFLDSDDYIELDCIETCYNECEVYDLDMLTFDAECFYDEFYSGKIMNENYDRSSLIYSNVAKGEDLYIELNSKKCYMAPVWINFYNNKFIKENKLFFKEGIVHEDEIHTCQSYLYAQRVKYIPNKFFNRRFRDNSIMTSKINEKRIDGLVEISKYMYGLYRDYKYNNGNKEILTILEENLDLFIKRALCNCDTYNYYKKRLQVMKFSKDLDGIIDINKDILINSPTLFYNRNVTFKNLFIVHTPYHILLAIALACSNINKYSNNEILINNNLNIEDREMIILNKIFSKIHILNNKYNLDEINDMLGNNKYTNIFVNNETEIHTQYILETRLKLNGNINYVEDGTACYISLDENIKMGMGKENVKLYSELLHINLEDIDSLGTYSKISKRYFIYPEYINKSLNDGKVTLEIDKELLAGSIKVLYEGLGSEILHNENNMIILLELSEFFEVNYQYDLNEYIEVLKELINNLIDKKEINIYLKYHPRETCEYMNLHNFDNIKYLDKKFPVEAFYTNNQIYLLSLKSTSLISACKIISKNKIISIDKIFNNKSDELINKFEEMGIFLPTTIDDILQVVK